VFKEIKRQSGFLFLYNTDELKKVGKVSVNVKDEEVEIALNLSLSTTGFTYKIVDKTIVLNSKPFFETAAVITVETAIDVKGKVTDMEGKPLVGATILIKGSSIGTKTDDTGNFSIHTEPTATLIISYVGYEAAEIKVGDRTSISIQLKSTNTIGEQVIVIGYGTQKKKDLTGAVSTLSAKDLENRPNTQFGYAIEGKAAGVQVIRSSGQPQAGFTIRVRGTSSITSGSDPLYVVDGVPTYNTNEINPADIESISILKDASSAAIYGSSGANGVVLITTKRGKNQKMKLSFNTSVSVSKAWKKMDMLNGSQFKDLATEMGATTDWNKYNANTNWQDEVFRNALTQNYQLSATGGTKKTSYYISGAAINQNGIVLNNNVKRATFKANIDHQLNKILKLGTSISFSNWKDIDASENNRNGVIARLYTTIPNIGIRDIDKPGEYARSPFINDLENPISTVYQPEHLFKNNRYHGNVYAEAEVISGLKLKSLFGFEKSNGIYTSFQDSVQTRYGKSMGGLASENTFDYKYWVSENTANFNKKIKDHNIAAMAGFIISRETNDNLYKSSNDFSGAKDQNVSSGNVKSRPSPDFAQKSHASFIGRFNYSYKDKYYLTSNFRADGSGQFTPNHRWGYFPSFSTGWRISQEDFFKNVTGISELKLRAGWGLVGNDRARPYAWYGLVDTMQKYLIGGSAQTAFINTTLENTDLKWEKTSQYDIGLDLAFLNNRLAFVVDYYSKKTSDLLIEVPIPGSVGIPGNTALQNAGSIENKGFEFQVISKNIVKTNLRWTTDFNISFNKGKVLDIVGTTMHTGTVNPAGTSLNTAIVQAGSPLGSFYGKISQGVDPATGKIKYMQTAAGAADSVGIIGNANPKFIYGLTNSFVYKNFTLDIFFQGVSGNKILNATEILTQSMSLPMNQSAAVLARWKKPGDITNIPGVSPSNWDNSAVSTRYIESGSYMRLKALTIGYNMPQSVLSKFKMSRFLLYVTAENLLTFTNYSGFDPEVSAFSGKNQGTTNQNTAPGVDYGTYPQSRDFILGLNISF
jgi:TonB-linked SusC/RagA family outer membrane protein